MTITLASVRVLTKRYEQKVCEDTNLGEELNKILSDGISIAFFIFT